MHRPPGREAIPDCAARSKERHCVPWVEVDRQRTTDSGCSLVL